MTDSVARVKDFQDYECTILSDEYRLYFDGNRFFIFVLDGSSWDDAETPIIMLAWGRQDQYLELQSCYLHFPELSTLAKAFEILGAK